MAVNFTAGKFSADNGAGLPLVGGLLYTYASGTTTPKATYTSSTLGTPNTNPIALDARGEASVWLGTGAYTMVLKTPAGVTIWTQDAIEDPVEQLALDLASSAAGKGAELVGASGGSGGTAFSTVAGFIARVMSIVGAAMIGFIQTGVGAVARFVQDKLRETKSITDFGAVAGGADCSAALAAAANAASSIYIPDGEFYIATPADMPSNKNLTFYGNGQNSVLLCETSAFSKGDVSNPLGNIAFKNFVIRGKRATNNTQLAGANLLNLAYGKSLRLESMNFEESRFFGVMGWFFDEVTAINCDLKNILRDGLSFCGSRKVKVLGGNISRCGDDAIAVHTQINAGDTAPFERDLIVNGVTITDCFGIKALGVRRAQITDNNISRCKGYCVYLGADGTEGNLSQYDIIIADNVMSNWLVPTLFGMPNTDDHAIVLAGYTGGTQRWYVEGPSSTKTDPRARLTSIGSSATHAPHRRVRIKDNIFVKEQATGVAYSAWGYGAAFGETGLTTDPTIPATYGVADGVAIDVGGRWVDVEIRDNTFHGLQKAIRGLGGSGLSVEQVRLVGNRFIRISQRAVDLSENGPHSRGVIFSAANHFNLDPLLENQERSSSGNGTWNGTNSNYATALISFNVSVVSDGDIFENCQLTAHNGGSPIVRKNSTFIGDPANGKGVPNTTYTNLIRVESDPTNAAYGNVLSVA